MPKFCGKCGSALNDNGFCPKCDSDKIAEINENMVDISFGGNDEVAKNVDYGVQNGTPGISKKRNKG